VQMEDRLQCVHQLPAPFPMVSSLLNGVAGGLAKCMNSSKAACPLVTLRALPFCALQGLMLQGVRDRLLRMASRGARTNCLVYNVLPFGCVESRRAALLEFLSRDCTAAFEPFCHCLEEKATLHHAPAQSQCARHEDGDRSISWCQTN